MTVAADVLRRARLFTAMTDRAIEVIGSTLEETAYADAETLVRQGEPCEAFIVLLDGRARAERNAGLVAVLQAGDFLGEIALIDGRPRTATVVAEGPVRAMQMTRTSFLRLVDEHPAIRYAVLEGLTERLRSLGGSDVA